MWFHQVKQAVIQFFEDNLRLSSKNTLPQKRSVFTTSNFLIPALWAGYQKPRGELVENHLNLKLMVSDSTIFQHRPNGPMTKNTLKIKHDCFIFKQFFDSRPLVMTRKNILSYTQITSWSYTKFSRSATRQYSHPLFGRGLRIIIGNFFCSNSISAMTYPSMISSLTTTNGLAPALSCLARSPSIFARSYLVMNGSVLWSGSIMIPRSFRTILHIASTSW